MAEILESLNLRAYLERIRFDGQIAATKECFFALHLAHRSHIPYENLDIQLGKPIRVDLDSVIQKLVHDRRGGYCFEQNVLLAAMLEHAGFQVTRLSARVRSGATRVLPRTHMILLVNLQGENWLADVGFGGLGLLLPIPLVTDQVNVQFAWSYKIIHESELWVLQRLTRGKWEDLFVFSLEPQLPVDYELANYYTSTHPDSRFVQTTTAQLATPECVYILRNREFITMRGDEEDTTTIEDDEELLRILREKIGLDFPIGTRFRSLTKPAESTT
jgi:N-hydroxyarylamine O-acetyltransferase